MDSNKIAFHFHPFEYDSKSHVIEKSIDGVKKRYLKGVSSGIKIDGHGERMTEKCIKSFMDQANSGDVLLYPDIHGIKQSEDIGILTKASVSPIGDWETEYKLYDESDGVGQNKLEVIDTIWKQLNGIAPYSKPLQKGFSIEGFIPDAGVQMSQTGKRVIDNVELDGVVLVPRPAYQDSVANAVYKALGELPPWQVNKVQKNLNNKLVIIFIQINMRSIC